MQLARYQVSTLRPPPILAVTFSSDGRLFTVATNSGYELWRTYPLALLRRRKLPGTLARAVPLPYSPLILLQGGGSNPLFPPNKAIIYHDGLGAPVAELEFGERIRGFAVRHRTIVIVLARRAIAYEYSLGQPPVGQKGKGKETAAFSLLKLGEWETAENESGLAAIATAPESTLLALPGRQPGHVQLLHLPPCPSPLSTTSLRKRSQAQYRSPIILAHTHPLSSLNCSATGAHLLTASERGTLLRVWDTTRGALESELRRGVDRAEIWGVEFEDRVLSNGEDLGDDDKRREHLRRKGGRVVGWSDKGTVHVWGAVQGTTAHSARSSKNPQQPGGAPPSLTNMLSKALSLPNYFSSTASYAQYYLPRKNPHAFSSAIGAAAEAAGVPSMRINEDGDKEPEEREWAERYVVGWIEVDVQDDDHSVVAVAESPDSKVRFRPRRSSGSTMGSREERRSFGSDATPTYSDRNVMRTGTPVSRRSETPTQSSVATMRRDGVGAGSGGPGSDKKDRHHRQTGSMGSGSGSTPRSSNTPRSPSTPVPALVKTTRRERQLVVVTYAGDWYRLRIPSATVLDDDWEDALASPQAHRRKNLLELVEYRRLDVGGGGW